MNAEVLFFFRPLEDLNETVDEHFLGYGTAAHEFFENHEQLVGMARMQADQLRDQEFTLTRKLVAAKLLADGATCLIVEEFELYMRENAHRFMEHSAHADTPQASYQLSSTGSCEFVRWQR